MSVVKVVLKDGSPHICRSVDIVDFRDGIMFGFSQEKRLTMRHRLEDIDYIEIDPPQTGKE